MKRKKSIKFIFSLILAVSLSFFSAMFVEAEDGMKGSSKEHKGSMAEYKGSGSEMGEEVMMAKWQEYSTPSEDHAILNALVGSWSYTMKHWMSADAPAEESMGSSESAWIMGGRFVEEKVSGTSMGQPFNGTSIMGYNNGTNLYSSYWLDNMSTGSMFTEGSYDAQTKMISSSGEFFCPLRDGVTKYRSVLTMTDENSHSYEMYMTETDGVEFLAMKIEYTRK